MFHDIPTPLSSSFRDPAGFVFRDGDVIKRAVTHQGGPDHQLFLSSGLRTRLAAQNLIVEFLTEAVPESSWAQLHTILVPRQIPYVSYPYEWSFDQLKDAALLTLRVEEESLACGMSLKDASAFNIQFVGSMPVFIDLSSFEPDDGGPWLAYEQFCRHFLGPLLLMQYRDPSANRFLRSDLEGLGVDFVSRLLPWRTWANPDTLVNIHLHARSLRQERDSPASESAGRIPALKKNLVASLRTAIERLKAPRTHGVWTDYAGNRKHYVAAALDRKQRIVQDVVGLAQPKLVFDLGANDGIYSGLASYYGYCVAFDSDACCVNRHYLRAKKEGVDRVLPLIMNLENPSPNAGFQLNERASMTERGTADLALALALVHHLRLTARAPFTRVASFLASLAKSVLVEFVPLSDPMAQQLLRGRTAGIEDYSLEGFIAAFERHFTMTHVGTLPESSRSLWMAHARIAVPA